MLRTFRHHFGPMAKRDLWTPDEASARFAEALKAVGKPYEFYNYDEGHLFFAFTTPE